MTDQTNQTTTQITSITGWWLNNPDESLFDREDTGEEAGSCVDRDTCMHYTHDEKGPVNRLILKEGAMTLVGSTKESAPDPRDPMSQVEFYQLPNGRFLKVETPFHYGASATIVDELPEFHEEEEYNGRGESLPLTPERIAKRAEAAARQPRPPQGDLAERLARRQK